MDSHGLYFQREKSWKKVPCVVKYTSRDSDSSATTSKDDSLLLTHALDYVPVYYKNTPTAASCGIKNCVEAYFCFLQVSHVRYFDRACYRVYLISRNILDTFLVIA